MNYPMRSVRKSSFAAALLAIPFAALQVACSVTPHQPVPVAEMVQRKADEGFAKAEPKKLQSTSKAPAIFKHDFANWEDNNLHWRSPSNIIIYQDGSWFIYASHLANMRRNSNSIINDGPNRGFYVTANYYSERNCTGAVIHSSKYHLQSLQYTGESDNVTSKGQDQHLGELEPQIWCVRFERSIEVL